MNDLADDVEELGEVAVTEFVAGPDLGGELGGAGAAAGEITAVPGRADAEGHVGVLGVGKDEPPGAGVRLDLGQLGIERFHEGSNHGDTEDTEFRGRSS